MVCRVCRVYWVCMCNYVLQARLQCVCGESQNKRRAFQRWCYALDVDVVLRKLGKGARAVSGRLVRAPRKGSVIVIEFPDGMHEYVTTPVKRVLRLAGREVFFIETVNSRYRLEVRGRAEAIAEIG
jgi:hypothetical protein